MRFHWLLSGFLGIWLLSSPVRAANLQYWRFDASRNRLEFTTDSSVQPQAQLISNPVRLVIDLPGITLGRRMQEQLASTPGIRAVRVGQFDTRTTRIVVEMARGYTIDPTQVKFQGISPSRWIVQLPTPQILERSRPSVETPPRAEPSSPRPNASNPMPDRSNNRLRSRTQLESVRVTTGGFFLSTSGGSPELEVERSRDRTSIQIDLKDTTIAQNLRERELLINSGGVEKLELSQFQNSSSVTRITLQVKEDSPNWQASISGVGGILILPEGGAANLPKGEIWPSGLEISATDTNTTKPNQLATIESIELTEDALVIRADGQIDAQGAWPRPSIAYNLVLSPAQLSDRLKIPQLASEDPLLRLNIEQQDAQTVIVSLLPVSGIILGNFNQFNQQVVSLPFRQNSTPPRTIPDSTPPRTIPVPPRPSATFPSSIPIPVPRPNNPQPSSVPPFPNPGFPNPDRRSRIVVVVDPGHGGRDPGAVGNGLQEKHIVLDISRQVASILQQNGIQVVMTRYDDREVDLRPRVQLAQRVNATLFVSIHANAISLNRPDVNGVETYYYATGANLARAIHNTILGNIRMRDRRVRRARFYVLRHTSMPSVLVETGFVTGAEDAPQLASPVFRRQMAQAIASGIIQYVRQNY